MGASFNTGSINSKVSAWGASPNGQQRISSIINNYIITGSSICTITGNVVTKAEMMEAASIMKNILIQCSSGLPASVQAHIAGVSIGSIVESGPGSFTIDLNFPGNVGRPSLQPSKYGGVSNIVALFNNGYYAKNKVFGEWHGHETVSKQERVGTHFVTQAVAIFNYTSGSQYHATANASEEYA